MRQFVTEGTGPSQILNEVPNEKIPIYDSLTDVEADLANLEEGQIVATRDEGSELSAPVDTVQSGNMHAVTSNAVAEAISFSNTEQEAGYYFDKKRYHKTFVFEGVAITADTAQVVQSNFEIPLNYIVDVDGFATDGTTWFKDLNIYVSSNNNSLCIYPKIGGSTFSLVIDVYYVKN